MSAHGQSGAAGHGNPGGPRAAESARTPLAMPHEAPDTPAPARVLRVGVVGARQAVQGIGAYVAREFARAGCEVAGIVGTSAATVAAARDDLARRFGLRCEGFTSLSDLLAEQQPHIVALCSPAGCHREQLQLALDARAHVFCEKPLWWDETCRPARADAGASAGAGAAGGAGESAGARDDAATLTGATFGLGVVPKDDALAATVRALGERFLARGLLLGLNTQWPCTLDSYRRLHPGALPGAGPWRVTRFDMLLSPIRRGAELVVDGAPHALSLLEALSGHGRVEGAVARWLEADGSALELRFRHRHALGVTEVRLLLRTCPQQPRPAGYGIDGAWAERQVTQPGYRMSLAAAGRHEPLHDPLDLRVAQFVAQVRAGADTDVQGLVESLVNLRDLVAAAEDRGRPQRGPATGPSPEVPA